MNPVPAVKWMDKPENHDYAAAENFLSLIMGPDDAKTLAKLLEKRGERGQIDGFKAKDILRASKEELLPLENDQVRKNLAKIAKGQKLSPILLVRGSGTDSNYPCIIADGYHRVCASYWLDENTEIPCVICLGGLRDVRFAAAVILTAG